MEVSHICYQYGYIEIAYEDTTDKSSSGLQRQVPSVCKEGQLTKNNLGLPKATDAIFNLPTSRGFVSIFRLDHQKCHTAVPYYLKLCFKEQEESLVGMGLCFAGSWSLVMDGFLFLGRQRWCWRYRKPDQMASHRITWPFGNVKLCLREHKPTILKPSPWELWPSCRIHSMLSALYSVWWGIASLL